MRSHSNLHIAKMYVDAGISIIPVKADGSKSPAIDKWNPYRQKFASAIDLVKWFSISQRGIGIVCGVQSGGVEVLDFDHNADENFHRFCQLIPASIYGKLCVIETAGGGYHVIYRSQTVTGNHKLAMTDEAKPRVLIESRGEGGYIVAVGSPLEVHSSKRPYVQILGQPLPELPVFTPEERKTLWQVAATFDQRSAEAVRSEYVKKRAKDLGANTVTPPDTSTPWGDFDANADWSAILEPHGWSTTDGVNWTRPGKSFGTSAKLNKNDQGIEVLTVFTSNAEPLQFEETYGPFNAYRILNHGGDNSQACKDLRRKGYGGKLR